MKKEDFRIGNYIWGVSDRIEQISELWADQVETKFIQPMLNESVADYIQYKDIQPIELNNGMFIKLGFAKNGISYSTGFINIRIVKMFNDEEIYNYEGIQIKYVHHLQNLVYELSRKHIYFLTPSPTI